MIKTVISFLLVSTGGIIALVKLFQALWNDSQKDDFEKKVKNNIESLKKLKPYKWIEKIGKSYLTSLLIEVSSYVIIILLLAKFTDFVTLIRSINLEIAVETFGRENMIAFLTNIKKAIDFITDKMWMIILTSVLLTAIRRWFRSDEDDEPLFSDIKDYFEDGSYSKFISLILFNTIKVGMICGFYYFIFDFLKDHTFKNTFLDNVIFYGAIALIIIIPIIALNVFYYFSISVFLLVVLSFTHFIILIFLSMLRFIDWIFKNPKKNWAIFTAVMGAISYIFKFWD